MATDFLEQLAKIEVPAVPDAFDRQVHDRVNRSLLMQQLLDLAVSGLPWAVLHFARAVVAVAVFTSTGRFPDERLPKQ